MLEFSVLQRKAKCLPEKLIKIQANQHAYRFFCVCIPSMDDKLLANAQLIQLTASCLDFYPDTSEKTKEKILIGIYAYVWYYYDNTLQSLFKPALIGLLKKHLGIETLTHLGETYYESLQALDVFCHWVFYNRKQAIINDLYKLFPPEMQGELYNQCQASPSDNQKNWSTKIIQRFLPGM